jgi:5-methyltetrahydrofolate--homocysteine methyltransferase
MKPENFLELLQQKIIVFDGAMGTMLFEAGLKAGGIPEQWNIAKPEAVMSIHQQYYEAGVDVVHTNTFGGTAMKLHQKGLSEQMEAINLEAVKLARRVCPEHAFVAGDLGPTGKMVKPLGDVGIEELIETFYRQACALLKGGVDLISIETMFSLQEAVAAVRGAKQAGNCPVVASITYNRTPGGFFTIMGESVEKCVAAFEEEAVDAIGSNCTLGSKDMIDLAQEMRRRTKRPILLQPNAGKPVQKDGVISYDQTADEFAADIKKIVHAGANMVGGCCGTNAEFMKAVVNTLRQVKKEGSKGPAL